MPLISLVCSESKKLFSVCLTDSTVNLLLVVPEVAYRIFICEASAETFNYFYRPNLSKLKGALRLRIHDEGLKLL